MADISANARALLDTIRFAEGTAGPQGYGTMFGGGTFDWRQGHPDRVVNSGGYSSAAAGAYQFMPGTWKSVAGQLGLKDFSPASQDLAALQLIRNRGVDPDQPLSAEALDKLAPEWASLPTRSGKSYYGQPVKSQSGLFDVYRNSLAGGGAAPASTTAALASGSQGVDFNQILGLAGLDGGASAATQSLDPVAAGLLAPLGLTASASSSRMAMGDDFNQELQQILGAAETTGSGAVSGDARAQDGALGGGLKEYLTGDQSHGGYRADHGGSNYHEHIAFDTPERAQQAARLLNDNGIQTTELKGINPVGSHAPNSYHYSGQAFDVPAAQVPVGQERELSRRVRRLLGIS